MPDLCLTLQTDPPVALYRGARPGDLDIVYPRLLSFTSVRTALRFDGGEVGNCTVGIDNADGSLTAPLAADALLASAELTLGGAELFSGVVQSVTLGASARLDIESGHYTDPLPLRTAAALGDYQDLTPLPLVYGVATLSPIPLGNTGKRWLLADHAIAGVDQVRAGSAVLGAWSWRNALDDSGHPIALMETQFPYSTGDLSVTLRGHQHPTTGALMDTPDLILWHLLSQVGGMTLDPARMDDLRAWCAESGLKIGGVLSDTSLTIQSAADRICQGCGLAWSPLARGLALPWPPIEAESLAEVTLYRAPALRATAEGRSVATHLEVSYDWDDAARSYRASLTVAALDVADALGREVRQSVTLPWVRSARDAVTHATRHLAWTARTLWEITASMPSGQAIEGDWVTLTHPYAPITSGVLWSRDITLDGDTWTVTGPQGAAPTITLISSAQINP